MQHFRAAVLVAIFFLAISPVFSQNCEGKIIEDKVVGGTQLLKAVPEVIIVRGTYTYSLDFRNERNGLFARVYSKGGEIFNQNDELIFIDEKSTRRSFRFVEMGEMAKEGSTPTHQNTLALDLSAMQWKKSGFYLL